MAEKLKLELSLVLPDVPDERDACVGRLTELLQAEGMERVHVIREDGNTRLCLHYDPQRFSVSRVRCDAPERHERHYRDDEYRGKPRASLSCAICSTEGRA